MKTLKEIVMQANEITDEDAVDYIKHQLTGTSPDQKFESFVSQESFDLYRNREDDTYLLDAEEGVFMGDWGNLLYDQPSLLDDLINSDEVRIIVEEA